MKEDCKICNKTNIIEMEDIEKGYFFCSYCNIQNNLLRDQYDTDRVEEEQLENENDEFDYGN